MYLCFDQNPGKLGIENFIRLKASNVEQSALFEYFNFHCDHEKCRDKDPREKKYTTIAIIPQQGFTKQH